MNNYVSESDCGLGIVAPATTTTGTPFLIGSTLCVPVSSQSSGEQVTVYTEGVFLLPKVSALIASTPHIAAEEWTLGQDLYWDATNSKVTPKALGHRIGVCTKAAASTDTVGEARLTPQASQLKIATLVFDATGGKAVGTHTLLGPSLPSGAVIVHRDYYVITTFQSATDAGTIALGVTTQDDDCLKTAVAISNGANPWDQGAFLPAPPAAALLATAERTFCAVVAVEALTAGKLVLNVGYHVPAIAA